MNEHAKIFNTINKYGYEAYFVGGCVRDIYLNIQPKDWDIVTSASPTKLIHIFKDENLSIVGKQFLVTIINNIEVATFRSERYDKYSGKPFVTKAISLEDDLSRRDFTINAMAFDKDGKLIDYFDGLTDLKNKVIKFVGNPKDRIEDDPIRIIRAFRFCCLFGDDYYIEYNTKKALKKYSYLLTKYVPVERIKLELIKVLSYKKPSIFIKLLKEFDLLKYILPSLHKCVNVDGGKYHKESVFEHNLYSGDFIPKTKPLLRLAGYLHDVGKPDAFNGENFRDHAKVGAILAESDMTRLRFSSREIHYVSSMVKNHMRYITGMKKSTLRRLIADLSADNVKWKDFLLLKISDRNANTLKSNFTPKGIKGLVFLFYNALKIEKVLSLKNLKIDGNDLIIYLGLKEGPQLGIILNKLFENVLDNPLLNHKFILLDIANKLTNTKELTCKHSTS